MQVRTLAVCLLAVLVHKGTCQDLPPDPYQDMLPHGAGYTENNGQLLDTEGDLCPGIKLYSNRSLPKVFVHASGLFSLVYRSQDTLAHGTDTLRRLDVQCVGELAQQPEIVPANAFSNLKNFYYPHCGNNGVTGVHTFNGVVMEDVYPSIDVCFYEGSLGNKVAFVVQPGADPADVFLQLTGQDEMGLDLAGNLNLLMADKWITLPQAVAFQYDEQENIYPVNWNVAYDVNEDNGIVGFNVDAWDPEMPLVILIGPPPLMQGSYEEQGLCWATYYGGDAEEDITDLAKDYSSSLYVVGGSTSANATFPVGFGVVTNYTYYESAFAAQFNSDDQLQWETFVGGEQGATSKAMSCVIRGFGGPADLYFCGTTNAEQFPSYSNGLAHYETDVAPSFIGRLDGVYGTLTWCSYFNAKSISEIGMAGNSKLFITGITENNLPDTDVDPPLNSTYWPSSGGSIADGYVASFDTQDRLDWTTFLPTSDELNGDNVYTPFQHANLAARGNKVVVVGDCNDAGMTTVDGGANAHDEPLTGSADLVIYEFDNTGHVQWGSYYGGIGSEFEQEEYSYNRVAINASGDIFVVGTTDGGVPLVQGGGWYSTAVIPGTTMGYVAKFSGASNNIRQLVWSTPISNAYTYLTSKLGCAVGNDGALYVHGSTRFEAVPFAEYADYYHTETINNNTAGGAVYEQDAFVLCFAPDNSLRWGTLFGGAAYEVEEVVRAMVERLPDGKIDAAGYTSKDINTASYFPLDDGGGGPSFWPNWFGGHTDGFIAEFCPEGSVNMAEQLWPLADFVGGSVNEDEVTIFGLKRGLNLFQVHDASGRLVRQGTLHVSEGGPATLRLDRLSAGSYVITVPEGHITFIKP